MYAPYGAGVLVAPRDFFAGAPEVMGGGAISIVTWDDTVWADLPDREEAGSPNVIGAVALGVAIETLLELGFDEMLSHEVELGSALHTRLSRIPGVAVLGGAGTSSAAPTAGPGQLRGRRAPSRPGRRGAEPRMGHRGAQRLLLRQSVRLPPAQHGQAGGRGGGRRGHLRPPQSAARRGEGEPGAL